MNEFTDNVNVQVKKFTTRIENELPEEASRLAHFGGDQVALTAEIKVPLYFTETSLS